MKALGYPAYTTSAGWLGYPEQKIRELCRELLAEGHKYFKMKVGLAQSDTVILHCHGLHSVAHG
jgi:L-fuconate dehydratase